MPSKPIADQKQKTPKSKKPAQDELDSGALDKVTGGLLSTGFQGSKSADPCEGGR